MATFTMRLSDALEHVYGTTMDPSDYDVERGEFTFNGVKYGDLPILPDNGEALGLAQYPIFNEEYRPILNGKIVDEYYNRELGMETLDDFKLALRRKMQQIMPYYNQLYESTLTEYGPLMTMDIHSVSEATIDGNETSTASNDGITQNTSGSRVVNSSTPQTILSGNGNYADSGTDSNTKAEVESSSEQTSTSNSDTTTNSDNRVTGYQGAASDLMVKFRASLINVDTLVIADAVDCFMLLLNNGDSYGRNHIYGWVY